MTKYYKDAEFRNGKVAVWSKDVDIDLSKYSPEIQELIKDILMIMGYEQ